MRIAIATLVLAWLAALSCYDLRERRLPNALTLPGAAVILLAAAVAGRLADDVVHAARLFPQAELAGLDVVGITIACAAGNSSGRGEGKKWN